jgi:ribosomal protein S18 acetylase RimI-like enzyme
MVDCIRPANVHDVDALMAMVNAAYRPPPGNAGWTHESKLVTGPRINRVQLLNAVAESTGVLLVKVLNNSIVACVQIQRQGADSYIGMLTVSQSEQKLGLGKAMLDYAETYAITEFSAERLIMVVLSARHELIEFYFRRGYARTGEVRAYPVDAGVGTPKTADLMIETLEKKVMMKSEARISPPVHEEREPNLPRN